VNELNRWIGVLRVSLSTHDDVQDVLGQIQQDLFDMGNELSRPGLNRLPPSALTDLQAITTQLAANLPAQKDFVLPAGNRLAAQAHLARTACRRAQLNLNSETAEDSRIPMVMAYLHSLENTLQVITRILARRNNGQETL
jgi:cob(I)alamin adenosyltransferase